MRKILLAAAAVSALAVPAHAGNMTAEQLAYSCVSQAPGVKQYKDSKERAAFCNTYISGWDGGAYAAAGKGDDPAFCPGDKKITIKQMSLVFVDYVIEHRDEAKTTQADDLLMTAMKDRWPCAQNLSRK
jgi:Ssp1 endopeptidase immunity protein Rap1a